MADSDTANETPSFGDFLIVFTTLCIVCLVGVHVVGMAFVYIDTSNFSEAMAWQRNCISDTRLPLRFRRIVDALDDAFIPLKVFAAFQARVFFGVEYHVFQDFCTPPYLSDGTRVLPRGCAQSNLLKNKVYLNDTFALISSPCSAKSSCTAVTHTVNVVTKTWLYGSEVAAGPELRLYLGENELFTDQTDGDLDASQFAYAMYSFIDFVNASALPSLFGYKTQRILIVCEDYPTMTTALTLAHMIAADREYTYKTALAELRGLVQADVAEPPQAAIYVLHLFADTHDWQEVGRILLESCGFSDLEEPVFLKKPYRMALPSCQTTSQ